MKIRFVLFISGFLSWILLTWSLDIQYIISGIAIGILVALFTADMFPDNPNIFHNPGRYLWFFYYIPVFCWECLKANLDGAYRVIHPDLPLKPGIVKVKIRLRSETGITFLANSLTLTPGTMAVDVDREAGFLYIHWIEVKSKDIEKNTELIVRRFEDILLRIFK